MLRRGGITEIYAICAIPPLLNTISRGGGGGGVAGKKSESIRSQLRALATHTPSLGHTHNKQQAGIKSICTEERGKSYDSYKCVQIFVVSVQVEVNVKSSILWCKLDKGIFN